MDEPSPNSDLLRRRIGREFAELRIRAGLSQVEAAAALDRGRATVGRIEEGSLSVRFRAADVDAMLKLYGADEEESARLRAWTLNTRHSKEKAWWHDYTGPDLPSWFALYVRLENGAKVIRKYESELVPGLLQTESYGMEVMRIPSDLLDESERRRRLQVRMERQSLLIRPNAPRLEVILNEAVLRRAVGGTSIMAEQLGRLRDIGTQANVSVRIVPFAAGFHGGMASGGPFAILEFPLDRTTGQPVEPPVAYVESLTGAIYLSRPEEVRSYHLAWADLEGRALDEAASSNLITAAMEGHEHG